MTVPCGANVRMLRNACEANNAVLYRRDAGQKYSVCRRNNRRPSKKGNNPECRGVVPTGQWKRKEKAGSSLFRDDENNPVAPEEFGFERWSISADSNWAICRRSSFGVPNRIDLVKLDGVSASVVKRLKDNKALKDRLANEQFGKSEFFSVEINSKFDFEDDGESGEPAPKVSLDGWIMLPRDWDPNDPKKYPVLVYVYGEPASQTVLDSWGGSTYLYHRAIAERGCVVLSVDSRGTPAPKGRKWRKCIYQKFD